jgi:hypothetical protein
MKPTVPFILALLFAAIAAPATQAQLVHLSGTTDTIYGALFEYNNGYSINHGTMSLDVYYNLSDLKPTNSAAWNLTNPTDRFHAVISVPGLDQSFDRQITTFNFGGYDENQWTLGGPENPPEWQLFLGFWPNSDPLRPVSDHSVFAYLLYPPGYTSAVFQLKASIEPTFSAVPEPSTYALGGAALLFGAVMLRCRRERQMSGQPSA